MLAGRCPDTVAGRGGAGAGLPVVAYGARMPVTRQPRGVGGPPGWPLLPALGAAAALAASLAAAPGASVAALRTTDPGLLPACTQALNGAAVAAYCEPRSRRPGRLTVAGRGVRPDRTRTGAGRGRWVRSGPLPIGGRLTLAGTPGRRAQLALLFADGSRLRYVRFAGFRIPAAAGHGTVTSTRVSGARVRFGLRIAGRTVGPVLVRSIALPPGVWGRRVAASPPQGASTPSPPSGGSGPARAPATPVPRDDGGPAFVPPSGGLDSCSEVRLGTCRPDASWDGWPSGAGTGWAGGDGAYSVALPDGRTLWLFGDTFVGGVRPDGTRDPATPVVRNSALIADAAGRRFVGTSAASPQPFVPSPSLGSWFWPADATVEGNELRAFMSRFEATGTGPWDFAHTGTEIASFHLPDLTFQGLTPVPASRDISWGAAILESAGHTYIYGIEDLGQQKYLRLARAPNGSVRGPWEYFDGSGWSPSAGDSARIAAGVSNQFSVIKAGGRILLVNQQINFGSLITVATAAAPWGPWGTPAVVYATPEPLADPHVFTYNAVAHPELCENGELLVSYNVSSFAIDDLYADARLYRPRFVRLPVCARP